MLDPTLRTLYGNALRPPAGYVFDQAVGTTYSLDLPTLLTIPMYLALSFGEEGREALLRDPVGLLEVVQRTASRVGLYCQQSQIHVPARAHGLFSLLEPVVREVRAPGGGAFHPKLWLLRFVPDDPAGAPLLRLAVLSRNLAPDRSWDLALVLDGRPGADAQPENQPLCELLRWLRAQTPAHGSPDLELLSREVCRARWELPGSFQRIQFHLLGLNGKPWLPPKSDELAVVSPFCSSAALARLARTSAAPVALVSRAEELACLPVGATQSFSRVLVLSEQAEMEDGEESSSGSGEIRGLHAKAYVLRRGWYTHLIAGSANATDAALVHGSNVELMAELVGKRSLVGGVDELLASSGFGGVLEEFQPPDAVTEPDEEKERALRALEAARDALASAGLRLRCWSEGDAWRAALEPAAPVLLPGVASVRVWIVSLPETFTDDGAPLMQGVPVLFSPLALASVTGFVAFHLRAVGVPAELRFVLNLPLEGIPDGRAAAIVRSIVNDRAAFLRLLMMLLGQLGPFSGLEMPSNAPGRFTGWGAGAAGMDELPLLEDMTRALCREPARLRTVQRLLRDLDARANTEVVPPEFVDLWEVFATVLAREDA